MSSSPIDLSTLGNSGNYGIDVQTTVAEIIAADSVPEQQLESQQSTLTSQTNALDAIQSDFQSLQTAAQALTNPVGAFSSIAATSSDTSVLTASATTAATAATHSVVVNSLATTSTEYTDPPASSTATFGTGSFDISVGGGTPTPINVTSSNNTLSGIAAAINQANAGVSAFVVTDSSGSRLALYSNTTGAPGNITISNNTTGLSFKDAVTGTDASVTVDGVPIDSSTNTVSGAIPGVTLNLQNANPNETIALSVAPDTSQATTAINNFVSAYNKVVQDINAQFTVSSSGSSSTTQPLESDSTVRMLQQELLSSVNFSPSGSGSGSIVNLSSLGVNLNADGTLSVDSSTLSSALTNNYSAVQSFMQGTAGFGSNLTGMLSQVLDPQGPIALDLQGISQSSQSLGQQISDMQTYLQQQQQTLTQEYTQVDVTLQQLPTLTSQIDAELGMNNSSSNG
jgi:flagellar hook-associated protein 2